MEGEICHEIVFKLSTDNFYLSSLEKPDFVSRSGEAFIL